MERERESGPAVEYVISNASPLLEQYVEYFIDRGVLGVTKDIQHPVLEYTGDPVAPGTRWKFDSSQSLVVPVMPPTLIGVCRLLQIYYVLKVGCLSCLYLSISIVIGVCRILQIYYVLKVCCLSCLYVYIYFYLMAVTIELSEVDIHLNLSGEYPDEQVWGGSPHALPHHHSHGALQDPQLQPAAQHHLQ